ATGKVPPRKAGKYKKVTSPPIKLSLVKEAEPIKKGKRVKRPAKKSATAPTVGVILRGTPGVPVSKKKAPAKGDGTDLESRVPDEKQRKTSGTDKGTSTKPRVPNVPTYDSESENESWGDSEDDNDDNSKGDDDKADSDDDGNSDVDDKQRTDSDDDENPSFTLKDYDEEEHDDKYELDDDNENLFEEEDDDDMYKDVDMRSLGTEHEKERQGDEEMTDADQNVSQELPYEQVVEDAHEESSTQAPSLFIVPVTAIPETATTHATTVSPTISMITPPPQLTTPYPALTTVPTTTSIPALPDFSSLFVLESVKSQLLTMVDELLTQEERKLYIDVVEKSVKDIIKDEVKSLLPQILPKEVLDFAILVIQSTMTESLENVYGKAYSLKRNRDDKDKDEDPPAGSDQGLNKKKTSKDVEPPKGSKSKDSKTSSSRGTKSQPKSSGKSVQVEEPVFEIGNQRFNL
ncbi:hypothetical protein Tco_0784178, partial [Tanacetum coccineum]